MKKKKKTRIIKSLVTGQAPVTLELRNTPGKNTSKPRWYTLMSQLTQIMPPPETYKSEIGSQSIRCARSIPVTRLITRAWKNRLYRLPPKKHCHVHITRSIYHYAYARQTQVNQKRETKKGNKIKEKEKRRTRKKNEKGKERKKKTKESKQENTRQEEEARKGKEKKNVILADPRS